MGGYPENYYDRLHLFKMFNIGFNGLVNNLWIVRDLRDNCYFITSLGYQ